MNTQERMNRLCDKAGGLRFPVSHSTIDYLDRQFGVCTRVEGQSYYFHEGYQGCSPCKLPLGYIGARLARLEAIVFGHSGDYTFWLGREGGAA